MVSSIFGGLVVDLHDFQKVYLGFVPKLSAIDSNHNSNDRKIYEQNMKWTQLMDVFDKSEERFQRLHILLATINPFTPTS